MEAYVFTVTDESGKQIASAKLECDDLDEAIRVVKATESAFANGTSVQVDPLRFLQAVRDAEPEGVTVAKFIGVAYNAS